MTCDKTTTANASEQSVKSAIDEILSKLNSDNVLQTQIIDTQSKSILAHFDSNPGIVPSNDFIKSLLSFITTSLANHEAINLNAFVSLVNKFYVVYCNVDPKMSAITKMISSLSLSLMSYFEVVVPGDLVRDIINYHSLDTSAESQQFLEMMAVKMPKMYLEVNCSKFDKEVDQCSQKEILQISSLISPLTLLMISKTQELEVLERPVVWAIKALAVSVIPTARQHCLSYISSYLLVKGAEPLQAMFIGSEVKFALFFSLACVEIRMALERKQSPQSTATATDSNACLTNDALSCILSALDVALEDICNGRVEIVSPDEFMTVFESFKAISITLFDWLVETSSQSGPTSPTRDWILTCNVWKLISSYLCETTDMVEVTLDLKSLIKASNQHLNQCVPTDTSSVVISQNEINMVNNLLTSMLPMFMLISVKEACVELMFELEMQNRFIHFLQNNVMVKSNPNVKSVILTCQLLVNLSAKRVLANLDQWNVDVSTIDDDDVFLHVTRLLLKSSCSSAIFNKSTEQLGGVVERLNRIALDVDGYHKECLETLEMLQL